MTVSLSQLCWYSAIVGAMCGLGVGMLWLRRFRRRNRRGAALVGFALMGAVLGAAMTMGVVMVLIVGSGSLGRW